MQGTEIDKKDKVRDEIAMFPNIIKCRERGTHRWETLHEDTHFDGVMIIRQCMDCGKIVEVNGSWKYVPSCDNDVPVIDFEKIVIEDHLEKVFNEIIKLKEEFKENPISFGSLENRLYWAMRGVDPHKSVCEKHGCKIAQIRNTYVCPGCIQENRYKLQSTDVYEENLWCDPDDKATVKLHKIRFIHEDYRF